jgi:predicted Rdx family selenoprotein
VRETDITLTPVHGGRLEIYVNGTKVYDRKEAEGAADFYPSLKEMRKAKDVLAEAIATTPATSAS